MSKFSNAINHVETTCKLVRSSFSVFDSHELAKACLEMIPVEAKYNLGKDSGYDRGIEQGMSIVRKLKDSSKMSPDQGLNFIVLECSKHYNSEDYERPTLSEVGEKTALEICDKYLEKLGIDFCISEIESVKRKSSHVFHDSMDFVIDMLKAIKTEDKVSEAQEVLKNVFSQHYK